MGEAEEWIASLGAGREIPGSPIYAQTGVGKGLSPVIALQRALAGIGWMPQNSR